MDKKEFKQITNLKELRKIEEKENKRKELFKENGIREEKKDDDSSDEDEQKYDNELLTFLLDLLHKKKEFDESFKNLFEHIKG